MPRARVHIEISEPHAIFGGLASLPGGALEGRFMEWAASSRFRAFAATYRDKVRKKLRLVRDEEGLRDLELELEVATRLLASWPRLDARQKPAGWRKRRVPSICETLKTSARGVRLTPRATTP